MKCILRPNVLGDVATDVRHPCEAVSEKQPDEAQSTVLLKNDGWGNRLIYMEAEYIRTCVVPYDIEVVFSPREVSEIQFVNKQGVFIEHGPGKHLS